MLIRCAYPTGYPTHVAPPERRLSSAHFLFLIPLMWARLLNLRPGVRRTKSRQTTTFPALPRASVLAWCTPTANRQPNPTRTKPAEQRAQPYLPPTWYFFLLDHSRFFLCTIVLFSDGFVWAAAVLQHFILSPFFFPHSWVGGGVLLLSLSLSPPASDIKNAAQHIGYSISTLAARPGSARLSARHALVCVAWAFGWLNWHWTGTGKKERKRCILTSWGEVLSGCFVFLLCAGEQLRAGNIKLFYLGLALLRIVSWCVPTYLPYLTYLASVFPATTTTTTARVF